MRPFLPKAVAALRKMARESESASIRRQAVALMRRYGLSLEEGENGPERGLQRSAQIPQAQEGQENQ